MNTRLLVENLKSNDKHLKLQSMRKLMIADDSTIDIVINELSEAEDAAIYWALDGIDYSEEILVRRPNSGFELLENTVGFKQWYVLAYTKILISNGNSTTSKLLPLLATSRTALNAIIAFVLGVIKDKSAVSTLLDRLKLSAIPEKIRVIQALGRLKSDDAIDYLHSLLPVEELTIEVAIALGRIGSTKSANPLMEQFRRDPKTAYAIGAALVKLGETVVEPLIAVIADSEAKQIHALAAEVLGRLEDKRATSSLINLVEQTSDDSTRHQTIVALGKLREPLAFPIVEKFMLNPKGLNDRYAATEALAAIDYDRAFDLFTRVLSDKSLEIVLRCHALYGYRLLGVLHNIQPLLDAVSDPDRNIRSTAVVQLASLQDERARPILERALGDPDWQTAVWAKEALERMNIHNSEK